jgi:hypothetical protein
MLGQWVQAGVAPRVLLSCRQPLYALLGREAHTVAGRSS